LRSWAGSWSRRFPTAMGYLCGYEDYCEDANNAAAGDKAIDNVDNKFVVVGDSHNYEVTLAVLEHRLPRFFAGALEEYGVMKKEGVGVENQVEHPQPGEEVVKMLGERMKEEVKVYEHVKRVLVEGCRDIPACLAVMNKQG